MSKKKLSWEEKKERIDVITAQMDESIESYFTTADEMKEYLRFMSQFYQYSPRNIALMHNQFSGAEAVGSFKFWKEKGYHVKKGEKGIQVLVPNQTSPKFKDEEGKWKNLKYANENERKQVDNGQLEKKNGKLFFSIGHVFDISQTNAKASDLPEIFPNRWLEGTVDNYAIIMDSLHRIGDNLNVTIGEPLSEFGTAKGGYYPAVNYIGLNPRNSDLQNVKTLIHELAHAKLHHGERGRLLSSEEKEFQAEMTAFSVASYFGIDTSDYSLKYLSGWTKGKELKDKSELLNEVRVTATEFVAAIETDLLKAKELDHEKNSSIKTYLKLTYGHFGIVEIEEVTENDIDDFINVETFNEKHSKYPIKYSLIDPEKITEPSIIIKWSEASHEFNSNEIMSYVKANEISGKLADNEDLMGYYKTQYSVLIPDGKGKVDVLPMERLDIGDGNYVNMHHQVGRVGKEYLTEKQWEILDEVIMKDLLEKEKREIDDYLKHRSKRIEQQLER